MKLYKFITILLIPFLLVSCSSKNKVEEDLSIEEMYTKAYSSFDKKNFETASKEFIDIENRYPSNKFATNALIMSAYSKYLDNDFAGTILLCDKFIRFHPGNENMPYILYLKGMSFYKQVSDVRRESGMSFKALETFQNLSEQFPKTEYAKNVKNKMVILKNYIAGKEMYLIRMDMKNKNWTSAINRLQNLIQNSQESVMIPEALFRLTECWTALGLPNQAEVYKKILDLNYPENTWTKKEIKLD